MLPMKSTRCGPKASLCRQPLTEQRSQKKLLPFHYFLLSSLVLILISSTKNTSWHVAPGETNLAAYKQNNFHWEGAVLFQSWERYVQRGNYESLKKGEDEILESLHIQKQREGNLEKRRVLAEELLEDFVRIQDGERLEEILPPEPRADVEGESPNEIDVSKPPSDDPIFSSLTFGEPIKRGNPRIQNVVPVDFEIQLLVVDIATNQLLNGLQQVLENYIVNEYQKLGSASNTIEIGGVDLTLQLVDSRWWVERRHRLLYSNLIPSERVSLRSQHRDMQERKQSSSSKIVTVSVSGEVTYSIEVDGSVPTPDDIEEQWIELYVEIVSQNRLQQAIENSNIDGILRVEKVETGQDPIDPSNNGLSSYGNSVTGNEHVDNSRNGNESADGNRDISSLYNDDAVNNFDNHGGDTANGENNETSSSEASSKSSSKKTSQLERPSALSIVFGFILTGIAFLGLVGYVYLFYRTRQKRLKKNKKVKESITFSSSNVAVTLAHAPPIPRRNSQQPSKTGPEPALNSVLTPNSAKRQMHSMMLSQSESVETSYQGLGSSIGSEDISDSFTTELRQAASRDQDAWDDFKRTKASHEKREGEFEPFSRIFHENRQSSARTSLRGPNEPSRNLLNDTWIEADLEGRTTWVKPYPYGDESRGVGQKECNEYDRSPSGPWEPYDSSSLPTEEKKDEANAAQFFAHKLEDIEKGLNISGGHPLHFSQCTLDDSDSTSDILSEVSELSKYVRRYERRKVRKHTREEYLHERRSVSGAPSYSSMPNKMSIGMDGHVVTAPSNNDKYRSTPLSRSRFKPAPLSSYGGSYKDSNQNDLSIQRNLSLVSEDGDDMGDDSIRSQRLGISPYRVSYEEFYYENAGENSSSRRTSISPARVKDAQNRDDFRASVEYGAENKKSFPRLAHLRANDAIIDNSNSEVNLSDDNAEPNAGESNAKTSNLARLNLQPSTQKMNTSTVISTPTPQQPRTGYKPTSSDGFGKIRGFFEQKTNEQPEPIYPPGEHWQYAGCLGKETKNNKY